MRHREVAPLAVPTKSKSVFLAKVQRRELGKTSEYFSQPPRVEAGIDNIWCVARFGVQEGVEKTYRVAALAPAHYEVTITLSEVCFSSFRAGQQSGRIRTTVQYFYSIRSIRVSTRGNIEERVELYDVSSRAIFGLVFWSRGILSRKALEHLLHGYGRVTGLGLRHRSKLELFFPYPLGVYLPFHR